MNKKLGIRTIGLGVCLLSSLSLENLFLPSTALAMDQTKEELITSQLDRLYATYKSQTNEPGKNLAKKLIINKINELRQTNQLPLRSDQSPASKRLREKIKEILKFVGNEEALLKTLDEYYDQNNVPQKNPTGQNIPQDSQSKGVPVKSMGQNDLTDSVNVQSNDIDSDYLNKEKIRDNKKIQTFAERAVSQALQKLGIKGDIKINPDQGWNSVAFVVSQNGQNKYLIKFAKGSEETEKLQKLKNAIQQSNPNALGSLALPTHYLNVQLNGANLPNFTIQIMTYFRNDAEFETILKQLCDEKWWKGNRDAHLKLLSQFGQSMSKLEQGDNKSLVHGDLFTGHVLINGYKLEDDSVNLSTMNPKFSLIDLPTMQYIDDKNGNMLLVDPFFLSTVVLFEKGRKNVKQGMLDIFNSFYNGYVIESSDATLEKLKTLLSTPDSAYEAFKVAAAYEKNVGKAMKTSEYPNKFQEIPLTNEQQMDLEKQLSNLHRLTFLHAYYDKKGDKALKDQIEQEQKAWDMDIFGMANKK